MNGVYSIYTWAKNMSMNIAVAIVINVVDELIWVLRCSSSAWLDSVPIQASS